MMHQNNSVQLNSTNFNSLDQDQIQVFDLSQTIDIEMI